MKFLKLHIFSVLFFLAQVGLQAQINNPGYKVDQASSDVEVCQNSSVNQFTVTAKKSTLDNFEMTLNFPPGVNYSVGSAVITGGTIGYTITEIDITNLNAPVLGISNGGNPTINWGVGHQVIFTVARDADCPAAQHAIAGNTFKDTVGIAYEDGGVVTNAEDNNPFYAPYNCDYASLSILTIPVVSTTVGRPETRDITIRQGGNGCTNSFEYFVVIGSDINDYEFMYGATLLAPHTATPNGLGTADTLFYTVDLSAAPYAGTVGNGDNCYDNGEDIIFTESFSTGGCNNVTVRHHAQWGCDGQLCQEASPQTGAVNFVNGVPVLTLTVPSGATNEELCDTMTHTVRITNTGSATNPAGGAVALDVAVIFGLGSNGSPIATPSNNTLWGSDFRGTRFWDNFRIGGTPVADSALYYNNSVGNSRGFAAYLRENFLTTDPDGPGGLDDIDGDGYFDDLAAGESFDVSFDFWIDPRENCGEGRFDYMVWEHKYFDVTFRDQCLQLRPPVRVDLGYRNIIRDYLNSTTESFPTDIYDGENLTIGVKPHFYNNGYLCEGEPMFTSSKATWSMELTVPAGLDTMVGVMTDADLAAYNPTITKVGNKIIYTLDRYVFDTLNFPLTFDCAQYSGPQVMNIPYTTHYFCGTPGVDTCFYREVHCGSVDIAIHCPGPCTGPVTFQFDANRTTPGYTDGTKTTLVTLDPAIHDTKVYNPFDTMLVRSGAYIADTALSTLLFDIELTLPNGGTDLLTFLNGEVIIDDISSGLGRQTFVLDGMAANLTNVSGNNYVYTVDVSRYTDSVSTTFLYGGEDGSAVYTRDSVWINVRFAVGDNFTAETLHEISPLRGEHYTFVANGDRKACDNLGDKAFYTKVSFRPSSSAPNVQGCNTTRPNFYITHGSVSGDNHPNEYRAPMYWDSTALTLPSYFIPGTNITFTDAVGNPLPNSINGDVLTIYRPVGHADRDKRTTYYPRFNADIIATCETPEVTRLEGVVHFKEYAYHPDASVHVDRALSTATNVTFIPPTWAFQALTPVRDGVEDSVSWDIELCNTTANTDVDYNWLLIEPQPNIVIAAIYDVSTGSEVPLVFNTVNDSTFVELGGLTRADCQEVRIYATYGDCSAQTLVVRHGWDCVAYPTDYSTKTSACYRTVNLVVDPKPSEVQLSVVQQPTTTQSLCVDTTFIIELNSAQLADLVNPSFEITGITGVSFTSVEVEYPKNSGNIETLTPTMLTNKAVIDLLDHSVIGGLQAIKGTSTTSTPDERKVVIELTTQFGCGFASNTSLAFAAKADRPCGEPATGNGVEVKSTPIQISGTTNTYEAFIGITIAPDTVTSCSAPTNVRVQTTIIGGTTSNTDTTAVELPVGVTYDLGSFACTSPTCPTSIEVDTFNGYERLRFAYPAGVATGTTLDYSFDIIGSPSGGCSPTENIEIKSYVQINGLTCGGTACGPIRVVTGESSETITIEKPSLVINNMTGFSAENLNGSQDYTLAFDIINNGTSANAGLAIDYYCADAAGNPIGTSIGSSNTVVSIANGETITHSTDFTAPASCNNIDGIAAIIVPGGGNQCMCDTVSFSFPRVSDMALLNLDQDNDGIPDVNETYAGDHDNDGVADYEDADFCAANFQGVNGWNCATQGLPDPDDDLDGDGIANYLDSDFPLCGSLVSGVCSSLDFDGDGIVNHLDLDADNDGIPDLVEVGGVDTDGNGVADDLTDTDGDGIVDAYDNNDTDGPLGTTPCSPERGCIADLSTSILFDADQDGTTDNKRDADADALPNYLDLDADNDGIPDVVEAGGTDVNGDGRADGYADTDNDGFNDVVDGDVGNDGIAENTANVLQSTGTDTDNDGEPNSYPEGDTDGDGVLDQLDLDADNDGIPDVVEAGGTDENGDGRADNYVDADNDGFNDVVDGDPTNALAVGSDIAGANTTNALQLTNEDTDNDGEPNGYPEGDTDGDGVLDHLDLDADNDGIPDVVEAGGTDENGDGRADNYTDADNDGFNDVVDGDPTNALVVGTDTPGANTANAQQITGADTDNDGKPNSYPEDDNDGDGLPNQLDLDADNDGIPDVVEAGGTDVNGDGRADNYVDADNDGFNDVVDGDPTNVLAVGSDAAGANTANATTPTGADTNNDGVPNNYPNDDFDNDGILNQLDLDADNDGILDIVEANGTDTNGDGQEDNYVDIDNDGFNDVVDGDPTNALALGSDIAGANTTNATTLTGADTNGDGMPNFYPNDNQDGDNNLSFLDIDADNDGIVDNTEGQPTATYIAPLGADADGDGIDDAYDNDDANFGGAGSGITPENTDGIDSPDYLDLDTDNDGEEDGVEGHDTNGDGIINGSDNPVASTGQSGGTTDTDGDGLLDGYDNNIGSTDPTNTGLNPNSHPDVDGRSSERDWREALDSDGDGLGDNVDLDDDNDGIPDTEEDLCKTAFTFDLGPEGWFTLNNNTTVASNPASHSLDAVTRNIGCPVQITGASNANIAGASPTNSNYLVDADPTGGITFTRSPNLGGVDYSSFLGGTMLYDLYNYRVGFTGNPNWLNNDPSHGSARMEILITNTTGGSIRFLRDLTPAELSNWENGIWNTFPATFDDASWSGSQADLEAVLSDVQNISIRVENIGGGDTGNCSDVEYYALDNVVFRAIGNITCADADGDGIPNSLDLDSDNDGIADIVEAGGTDTNGDGRVDDIIGNALINDTDGDGLDDRYDANNGGTDIANADTDGDGVPDVFDLDADNDGIPDVVEAGGTDENGDGRADNYVDTDNDGFNDVVDGDVGNDGVTENIANVLQTTGADTDGDGVPNSYPEDDNDGDGLPNQLDLDADNDGIPDVVEAGGTDENGDGRADSYVDADNDGFNDVVDGDPTNALVVGTDTPGANTANAQQPTGADTDNDGVPNSYPEDDNDGDGLPNQYDLDADNDGISDVVEAGGTDANGDGRADNYVDADNDGFNDVVDGDPTNALALGSDVAGANTANVTTPTGADTDGDGVPNSYPEDDNDGDGNLDQYDLDADNDGIPDVVEAGGTDENGDGRADNYTDTDNDGFNDVVDGDVGNDGIAENTANAQQLTGADTDNDGEPNSYPEGDTDSDGVLDQYDLDADNDGIADVVEAGGTDANGDGRADNYVDADNDGFNDVVDGDPTNALVVGTDTPGANTANATTPTGADTDGDGVPNSYPEDDTDSDGILDQYDLDSDNDGIPDVVEADGTDENGDGRIDNYIDNDNDGFNDVVDGDPTNTLVVGSDINGANTANALQLTNEDTDNDGEPNGYPEGDADGDGILNQLDLDSDNDGIADVVEANGVDRNGDGRADGYVDTDGDGYNDVLDADPNNTLAVGNDGAGINSGQSIQLTGPDTDGDGRPNTYPEDDTDNDGIRNQLDLDADDDGILDILEAGGTDLNRDGQEDNYVDVDGDGFNDNVDGDPDNSLATSDDSPDTNLANVTTITGIDANNDGKPDNYPTDNSDNDIFYDFLDIDADNDGIVDNTEAQATFAFIAPADLDDDNDGIDNAYDTDNANFGGNGSGLIPENTDGTDNPDYIDLDTDNDGEPDTIEGHDTNGDGVVDGNDTPFSNTGLPGSSLDVDRDGLLDGYDNNNLNPDATNIGLSPSRHPNADGQTPERDWREKLLNLDQDNDGTPDIVEAYSGDADNDGTPDYEDADFCAANFQGVNGWNCGTDGLPDPDGDMDGDGVPNFQDTDFPNCGGIVNGVCITFDGDADGIPNHLDLDADNDGIPDVVEAGGTDTDGDGQVDDLTDTDGDGLADIVDNNDTDGPEGTTPCSPQTSCLQNSSTSNLFDTNNDGTTDKTNDTDGDGVIDALDLDADNDGIPDVVEAGGTDEDGDGRADNFVDTDSDGFNDVVDGDVGNDGTAENTANALQLTGVDIDNDGQPNSYPEGDTDGDGILDQLDLDADNDGIPDVVEAGGTDINGDGRADNYTDADNDGFNDVVDGDVGNDGIAENTANALQLTGPDTNNDGMPDTYPNDDLDGDGIRNQLDLDADNDGILDIEEAGGTDADRDGIEDNFVDTDNDGFNDAVDGDPTNVLAVGSDVAGANTANATTLTGEDPDNDGKPNSYPNDNQDGDNNLNFLDIDADNDGIVDNTEGQPTLNYIAPTGGDADGDGIDDAYDSDDVAFGGVGSGIVPENTDGTDNPDYLDLDTDNDGEPDTIEGHDTNGDGVVNGADAPITANTGLSGGTADIDGDGLLDGYDNNTASTDATNTGLNPNSHPDVDVPATPERDWREGNKTYAINDVNTTPVGVSVNGQVLTNDLDVEGNTTSVTSITVDTDGDGVPETVAGINTIVTTGGVNEDGTPNGSAGTIVQNGDGTYTFTPTAGFVGEVTYSYTTCDDGTPVACDVATVTIDVVPRPTTTNGTVIATPDVNITNQGVPVSGNALANDTDPDGDNIIITAVQIDTDGDGVVDAPVAVDVSTPIAGKDANGNPVTNAGSLTQNGNGTYVFTPNPDFIGVVEYIYTVCDNATPINCRDTKVTIDVLPTTTANSTNANDDEETVEKGQTLTDNVLTNDSDVEGDNQNLGVTLVSGPTNGTLVLNPDGSYTYTPIDPNFVGNDEFVYSVCDDGSPVACDTATVYVTVLDVNRDYSEVGPYGTAAHRGLTDTNSDNIPEGTNDIWLGNQVNFEEDVQAVDNFDDAMSVGTGAGDFPDEALAGQTYNVEIDVNSTDAQAAINYGMWIDWNNDGVYDDFFTGVIATAGGTTPSTATVAVTVPASFSGTTTVNARLRTSLEAFAAGDAVGTRTNGEVEDYEVVVVDLPVELLSFTARLQDKNVGVLDWVTATEINNAGFEIEHALPSTGAPIFQKIAYVQGAGTTVIQQAYQLQVADLVSGVHYFRLKQVDFDGTATYSEVRALVVEEKAIDMIVYPNPAINQTTIDLGQMVEGKIKVQVYDNIGQLVISQIEADAQYIDLNTDKLAAATYTVKVTTAQGARVSKLIISRD